MRPISIKKQVKTAHFLFLEIPVGTYTLSISHPTYSIPTKIPIEIRAGEVLRGRFYPGAAVPFINTTDSGDVDGYVYSPTTDKPLAEATVIVRFQTAPTGPGGVQNWIKKPKTK